MVMIDRDVMVRAAQVMGCNLTIVHPRKKHWKEAYSLRVRGARAVDWMKALRPLLGERRRTQIDRAVASYAPRSNQRLDDEAATTALKMLRHGASVRDTAECLG
jgi:hypothetical protein